MLLKGHVSRALSRVLLVFVLLAAGGAALAQTTTFTYQGRLNDGGTAANGVVDMQFKLYDAADPGASAQIGSTITNSNVAVTNGIFTVRLDFGASALPGANRFLEVGVRRSSSDPYTLLAPRQQVTSAPYAIRSANAVVADQLSSACVGCVQDAQISSVAGSKLTGPLPAGSIPSGNSNYIQSNPVAQQAGANFNISGNGTAGTLNAATQYNIGGNRVFGIPGTNNTFVGVSAGQSNTTGSENTFFGSLAGFSNTTGFSNSFFGFGAGVRNQMGSENAFFGRDAGALNTMGTANAFFGRSAGNLNTTGSNNAFFGRAAGRANTTGSNNAFFGDTAGLNNMASGNAFFGNQAGVNNTSGESNSFFGTNAGQSNTKENNNTFIGALANGAPGITNATAIGAGAQVTSSNTMVLGTSAVTVQVPGSLNITTLSANAVNAATQYNISGNRVLSIPGTNNIFAGVSAGQANTDGVSNSFFGSFAGQHNKGGFSNAFFGSQAGQANTTGAGNAFFGESAGNANTGSSNAFFGNAAGFNNANSGGNSFFGADAGLSNTSGANNSFFGFFAGGTDGISNATAIGANASVTQSNSLVLGGVSPAVNVGIGTPAPLARLDVRGDVFVGLTAVPDNTTTPGNNIYVADDGGGDAHNSFRIDSFSNNFYFVARSGKNSTAGTGIVFRTAPAGGGELDRVSIKSDGTVVTNNDLVVNGNTEQPSDKNGLMKAMLFVSANGHNPGYTIVRCYNGVSGSSSGTCGFSISQPGGAGPVNITFPFKVSDRFFSLTLANASPNAHQVLVPFDDPSGRTVTVYITAEVADITDFYLIVY
jgi:hypothetical protein